MTDTVFCERKQIIIAKSLSMNTNISHIRAFLQRNAFVLFFSFVFSARLIIQSRCRFYHVLQIIVWVEPATEETITPTTCWRLEQLVSEKMNRADGHGSVCCPLVPTSHFSIIFFQLWSSVRFSFLECTRFVISREQTSFQVVTV